MARPFWLRLFGPDGPTTIAGLREALTTAQFGQGIGDGRFLDRLFGTIGRPEAVPERPGPREDTIVDPGFRDRETLVPEARDPAGSRESVHDSQSPDPGPVPAAEAGGSRTFVFQIEPAGRTQLAGPELTFAIGTNAAELAERQREQDTMPSGSWTRIFLDHDFASLIDGVDASSAQYDAAAFAALKDSATGFDPAFDTLALSGDFSAGFTLSGTGAPLGQVSLLDGSDYALMSDDDFVRADNMMIVDASRVGAGHHVMFDGSTETDGLFSFLGSTGDDFFFGGAGNDLLRGGGGSDALTGGAGSDVFVYRSAGESTGGTFDILADFDSAADRIDLPVTVTGFDAAVQTGTLSADSAAQDLAAALGGLGAGHAVLFTPDAGDLAGTLFLVVDGNGVAGYQEGEDYVFALPATTPADLTAHTDFFI